MPNRREFLARGAGLGVFLWVHGALFWQRAAELLSQNGACPFWSSLNSAVATTALTPSCPLPTTCMRRLVRHCASNPSPCSS